MLAEEGEEEDDDDYFGKAEQFLNKISMLGKLKNAPADKSAVVSGIDEQPRNVKENITRAITILMKNNNRLDEDLLKLADISEKQPAQFEMLINALRKM
jgi:hypothetical protein